MEKMSRKDRNASIHDLKEDSIKEIEQKEEEGNKNKSLGGGEGESHELKKQALFLAGGEEVSAQGGRGHVAAKLRF